VLSRFGCNFERADAASVQIRASRVTAQIAAFVVQSAPFPILGHSPLGIAMEQSAAKHIICHVNDICDVSDGVGAGKRTVQQLLQGVEGGGVGAKNRDGTAKTLPGSIG